MPNDRSLRRGERLLHFFRRVEFPDYYFHYRSGGHVAALHGHLVNTLFFKIDVQNFFYSITRERVTRALRQHRFQGARNIAMWSCVRNPYPDGPAYVLPIGFIQSPLLATLVLVHSEVHHAIERAKQRGVFISVYLDDFIGSHTDGNELRVAYEDILAACERARLTPNPDKLISPARAIVAFNCNLEHGNVDLTANRLQKFLNSEPSEASRTSFEMYRENVTRMNVRS